MRPSSSLPLIVLLCRWFLGGTWLNKFLLLRCGQILFFYLQFQQFCIFFVNHIEMVAYLYIYPLLSVFLKAGMLWVVFACASWWMKVLVIEWHHADCSVLTFLSSCNTFHPAQEMHIYTEWILHCIQVQYTRQCYLISVHPPGFGFSVWTWSFQQLIFYSGI